MHLIIHAAIYLALPPLISHSSLSLGGYEPEWGEAAASKGKRHYDQARDGLPVPPHI